MRYAGGHFNYLLWPIERTTIEKTSNEKEDLPITRSLIRQAGFLILVIALVGQIATAEDKTVDIEPTYQQTPEWCWLAVGQMILEKFDEPNVNPAVNYQCGIMGLFGGPGSVCWSNCLACPVPAGSTSNIVAMLKGYPVAAARVLGRPPRQPLQVHTKSGPLSFDDLKDEIDNDRPVVAGISPSGGFNIPGQAQHAVLIIGYDDDDHTLTVNDPFPYEAFGVFLYQQLGGTKLELGQYSVDYKTFRDQLGWTVSLVGIKDPNGLFPGKSTAFRARQARFTIASALRRRLAQSVALRFGMT